MEVIKKKSESTYYDIDEFCCKKFKKYYCRSIVNRNGDIWISNDYEVSHDLFKIDYCPFCGQKITRVDYPDWKDKPSAF